VLEAVFASDDGMEFPDSVLGGGLGGDVTRLISRAGTDTPALLSRFRESCGENDVEVFVGVVREVASP